MSYRGDRLQLIVRVARLYYEDGVRQAEIAERLHVSQPQVSRLLKEAAELGVVRTVVVEPPGLNPGGQRATHPPGG